MLDRIGLVVLNARQGAGRSREELAAAAGIQVQTLEALERGQPAITTTQLHALARILYLEPGALLDGREEANPLPSVFLRHAPAQDFDYRDSPLLDEALEEGRALTRLRQLLARKPLGIQAGVFQPREASASTPDAPARDGYKLAREVRKWLGLLKEPIADARLLVEESFGAAVVIRNLASGKVTAAGVRAGQAAAIVLSATDPRRAANPLLSRVILAHELCHLLFDPLTGGLQIVIDADLDRKTNAAEQRARGFAAEMLLPLEGLTALLGPAAQISDMEKSAQLVSRARSHFGTTHKIAANHLCNLGFVDKTLREWLEAGNTPFVGVEPLTTLPAAGEPSFTIREHVESAHRDGIATDGEARSILRLDRLAPLPWDPPAL